MKSFNKLLSVVLSLCLCFSCVSVSANEVSHVDGIGSSPVELTMDSSSFSVSLPLGLLVEVTRDGEIYTATEAYIINNCRSPIIVEDVLVETNSPWELANFDSAFYSMPVNTPKLGFQLNSENVGTDGKIALNSSNWPVIYGFDRMQLDYDANLPAISADKQDIMGNVVFTIGFWESDDNTVISSTKFNSAIFDIKDEYQFSVNVEQESVTIDEPAEDSLWVWTENDDSTLTIVGYNGDLDASQNIVVPSEINGATVTTLADGTFNSGSAFTVNSMSIPKGMTVQEGALGNITASTVSIADNCVLEACSIQSCNIDSLYIGYGIDLPGNRSATTTSQGTSRRSSNSIIGHPSDYPGGSVTNLYLNSPATHGAFEYCYVDNLIFGDGCDSIGRFAFAVADTIKSFKGIENVKFFGRYCFAESGSAGYIYFNNKLDESFENDLIISSETTVEDYALKGCNLKNIIVKKGASLTTGVLNGITVETLSIEDASTMTAGSAYITACNIGVLNIDGNIPKLFAHDVDSSFPIINLGPNVESVGRRAFGWSVTWASNATRTSPITSLTGIENVKLIEEYAFMNVQVDSLTFSDEATIESNGFSSCSINSVSVGPNTVYSSSSFDGAEVIVREE